MWRYDDRVKRERTPEELARIWRRSTETPYCLKWACDRSLMWGVMELGKWVELPETRRKWNQAEQEYLFTYVDLRQPTRQR